MEPGTVARPWRYPVKSMLGEECDHLDVDQRGAEGDRLFAVRDADGKFGSGKTTRRFRKTDGLFGFAVHAALSEALGQPVTQRPALRRQRRGGGAGPDQAPRPAGDR